MYGPGCLRRRERERLLLPDASTTSRSPSRPSPRTSTSRGCCAASTAISPALGIAGRPRARVLASGVAVPWALEAQQLLGDEWGVDADVWSVTSWNELRRDAVECERVNLLDPSDTPAVPYVTRKLADELRPGRRGLGLHARRARPDRAVGAGRLHLTRRRRVRLRRHPRRGAALLPHRRPVDRGRGARAAGPGRRGQARGARARRSSATNCSTCRPRARATPAASPNRPPAGRPGRGPARAARPGRATAAAAGWPRSRSRRSLSQPADR